MVGRGVGEKSKRCEHLERSGSPAKPDEKPRICVSDSDARSRYGSLLEVVYSWTHAFKGIVCENFPFRDVGMNRKNSTP